MDLPNVYIPLGTKGLKGFKIQKAFELLPTFLSKELPEGNWVFLKGSHGINCDGKNSKFFFKLPKLLLHCYYFELCMQMHASAQREDEVDYRDVTEADVLWTECCELYQMVIAQIPTALKLAK